MLKEYEVKIRETLEKKVTVEAESPEEAEAIVEQNWKDCEYILDAECFAGVEFAARKARGRERDEGR